jgi:hypothetical protein
LAPPECRASINAACSARISWNFAPHLQASDSVVLTCLRELKNTNIEGVTYSCTDETIFSIATSGTTKSIKIPKLCSQTIEDSRADKLEKHIDESIKSVKGELDKLNEKVDVIQSSISAMQSVSSTGKVNGTHRDIIASEKGLSGTDDLGNTTNVLCPPGSFVSGIQGLKAGNQT